MTIKNFNTIKGGGKEVLAIICSPKLSPRDKRLFVLNKGSQTFLMVGYSAARNLEDLEKDYDIIRELYEGDKVEICF